MASLSVPSNEAAPSWRAIAKAATAALAVVAVLIPSRVAAAADPAATNAANPTVTRLSVRSGGTWGGDLVTITGSGFTGTGARAVSQVFFGPYPADGFKIVNDTTVQAWSPEIANTPVATDVRVLLRDRTLSPRGAAGVFTFVVPNLDTRINGGWTANQSRAIGTAMLGRAPVLEAQPVAANPGSWTPAMGRSAVQRAAGWLGMPYSWAGGTYTGPSFGSCYGDGSNHVDCTYQGFDCSGLTLYAWAKYQHLAHFAATQFTQAGMFHPSLGELQPGDLMFFSGGGPVISHVVMYAGNGVVIQASSSGWPVRYTRLSQVLASHPVYFGATRPMSLGVQGAAPVVSGVSITRSGTSGGATVAITGAHLDTASMIYFGEVGTYKFSIKSPNAIIATVPANVAGIASVRVYNAWGESAINRPAAVTYYGTPAVTALSLPSAPAAGGSTMIITGSSFAPGTLVYFGASPAASVRVLSTKYLSVVTPAQQAGPVAITVRTAYGLSAPRAFNYDPPPSPPTEAAPSG